uniref:Uncharacterized protein n=1 Tax=Arundo donax TaxID=35708 RepID=A0A0A9CXW2_ARUDO
MREPCVERTHGTVGDYLLHFLLCFMCLISWISPISPLEYSFLLFGSICLVTGF